jgi:hypothetical protein
MNDGELEPLKGPDDVKVKLQPNGTVTIGEKRFHAQPHSLRNEILRLMSQDGRGRLLRRDYHEKLIELFVRSQEDRDSKTKFISEPFLKRQNNVDKALSRLRKDLGKFFKKDLPVGTSWICFSKRLDGWLLYRLPGLGCDGELHS